MANKKKEYEILFISLFSTTSAKFTPETCFYSKLKLSVEILNKNQCKQESSKEALYGSHQDLLGVIIFPCSNQGNMLITSEIT